jgi:hypothetical protein
MKSTGTLTSEDLALQQLKAPPVIHGPVSSGSLDGLSLSPSRRWRP